MKHIRRQGGEVVAIKVPVDAEAKITLIILVIITQSAMNQSMGLQIGQGLQVVEYARGQRG